MYFHLIICECTTNSKVDQFHQEHSLEDVPGDGNCFYSSVARAAYFVLRRKFDPNSLRAAVIQHLFDVDADTLSRYLDLTRARDANALANTVMAIGTYEGWGGSDIAVVLGDALGINIRIWVPRLGECEFPIPQAFIFFLTLSSSNKQPNTRDSWISTCFESSTRREHIPSPRQSFHGFCSATKILRSECRCDAIA